MGRIESKLVFGLACWSQFIQLQPAMCSEFPERECCEPIYPLISEVDSLPPVPLTTVASYSSSLSVGMGGGAQGGALTGRSGQYQQIYQEINKIFI